MSNDGKLMEMLTGYAAAHRHPFNIFVHMLGIPTIMLGLFIPLSWVGTGSGATAINLAHVTVLLLFFFYITLDRLFAVVFLVLALLLASAATYIGDLPLQVSGVVAAGAFFGGYLAQFIGHAVEKSMPVLIRHPVQANLAAPFFTVVELFRFLGLRDELFVEVQRQASVRENSQA